MHTFDLIVNGCGGGPDETNLSSYLLKPSVTAWEDGIVAVEAGSGQGALSRLLCQDPHLFSSRQGPADCQTYSASEIYSFVRCFLISHAHLDHVNSLVISAGSFTGVRKRIYAAKQTLQDLETVFAGRIWPNLASWNESDENSKLLYSILHPDDNYEPIYINISVRTIPVNHGCNDSGQYDSAAFFIRYDPTGCEFLFFGDVEPDSLTSKPQTINVWRAAAPKIPHLLSTIFIECSWPSERRDDMLYGHLKPEHLVDELTALAAEVIKIRNDGQTDSRSRPVRKKQRKNPAAAEDLRGALTGVRVFVTHCKDLMDVSKPPVRHLIVEQIRALVAAKGLGAEILPTEQGMRIEI